MCLYLIGNFSNSKVASHYGLIAHLHKNANKNKWQMYVLCMYDCDMQTNKNPRENIKKIRFMLSDSGIHANII